jgi:hypothetical protein
MMWVVACVVVSGAHRGRVQALVKDVVVSYLSRYIVLKIPSAVITSSAFQLPLVYARRRSRDAWLRCCRRRPGVVLHVGG